MGFYLRCRRLQSGAAAQADSGGLLMDKLPRFAKVFAGRRRIVEMDISLRLRNLAEFFNSLLGLIALADIDGTHLFGAWGGPGAADTRCCSLCQCSRSPKVQTYFQYQIA